MRLQRDPLVEVGLSGLDGPEQGHQEGKLDDAHRLDQVVGVDPDLLARQRVLDVDAPLSGDARRNALDRVLQVSQHAVVATPTPWR